MSRGGKRPGSGRKRIGDDVRVVLSCRVQPATRQALTSRAESAGISLGALLDQLAAE